MTFGFHEKDVPYDLERVRKNVLIGNTDKENPTTVMGNVGHTLESANKEIGSVMGVSTNTVKYHLKQIYGDLRVKNRASAVNQARELGIIDA